MINEKIYLADQIGEEYKSWKEGELIFIQAPTGTGKSYFILNVLLDWAVLNRFSILYLGNNAYRFINAVSDFATHAEPLRKTKNYRENMFSRTIDGNPLIDRAYQMVCA